MTAITKISGQRTFPVARGCCIDWAYGPEQKITVALPCPTCGRAFCLAYHSIDAAGRVSPSVVCPYRCGFHEFVQIVERAA